MRPVVLISLLLATACTEPRRRTRPPVVPPPAVEAARLSIVGYTFPLELGGARAAAGRRFLQVELTLENSGSETPIPAGWGAFELTSLSGSAHLADRTDASANPCTDTTLVLHANRTCSLAFELAADARPAALGYDSGVKEYTVSFDGLAGPPMLCDEPSPESTIEACSDGCNNDGDPYLDCNDANCCGVRASCPIGTYCGGSIGDCDCTKAECCDLISCGPETPCGQLPDPFAAPLSLDDARVSATDPTTLRAGATPCRAPVLARIEYVNDGDTVEVSGEVEGPVRMIGVDTPEVSHGNGSSECFGDEASSFTQQLRDRLVWLTFDAECQDQFGRTLAYVHLGPENSHLYQRQLLRRGLARTLTISPNDTFEELFERDQALATESGAGLWQACN